MPDWSYRTVFRPIFFRMPPARARDLAFGVVGTLGRSPIGPAAIDFLGHMRPAKRLARRVGGIDCPTALGLGAGVDPDGLMVAAFSRFGFGFLEVGPVTLQARAGSGAIELRASEGTIEAPDPPDNPGVDVVARRLRKWGRAGVPVVARLAADSADELKQMVEALAPVVDAFALAMPAGGLAATVEAAKPRPVWLVVGPDRNFEEVDRDVAAAIDAGAAAILVDGGVRVGSGRRAMGVAARGPTLALVAHLRGRWGNAIDVVASGGVHEPEDALHLIEAGADLVQVDSGLAFGGPGLPKRINEALLFAQAADLPEPGPAIDPPRAAEMSWFWDLLMGAGMLLGGGMAWAVAATRVVLPYDEQFLGLTRQQIHGINNRLLAFMAHDRVTLAGTMVATGVMYVALAGFGVRRGQHWAKRAISWSATTGFATFFLFLGFGYFDPFHAFVTAILFQFLLLGWHSRLGEPEVPRFPNLRDDWRWRWSLWGQLAWIVQGSAFIVAGLVIAGVGITTVFVPEDLEFLHDSAESLAAAHPRLVPLVAHDRASFGGMLVSSGLIFLLPTLWGFRRGAAWLWWAVLIAGLPGYVAAIGVHAAVGYHNLWHLAPAFAGLALFAAGLALSYPDLVGTDPAAEAAWRHHLDRTPSGSSAGRS